MPRNKNKESKQTRPDDAKIKRIVKSMVNKPIEVKYFDQITAINPTTSGTLVNISDITRGVEVTQRIGNQLTLKEFDLRIECILNANVQYGIVRFMILVDKQGYNAPVVSDVLEAGLVGTTYTSIAPYQWDYRRRFKILIDEVVPMIKNGPGHAVDYHIRRKLNMEAQYIGNATTFTNQIYILTIGTETNVLNLSTINYAFRLLYTDQ